MRFVNSIRFFHNPDSGKGQFEKQIESSIVSADRFSHGIMIQFDDGNCALFPATLLHSLLPQLLPYEDD